MSYVDGTLITGETVIHRGNISWWSVLPRSILAGFLLISGLAMRGPGMLFVLLALAILATAAIRIYSTELALTNKRVIAKFGLIRTNTIELRLEKMESIQVHQGIVGRIFNFGSLIASGTGSSRTPIPGIDKPMDFRRQCMEAVEAAGKAV